MRKDYTIEEIRDALRQNCGIDSVPYLEEFEWSPPEIPGRSEILQIGIRDDVKVFASFRAEFRRTRQIVISYRSRTDQETKISTKDFKSHPVTLIEPFSYWTSTVKDQMNAQNLRIYLRGCFALRGHAGDSLDSFDLQEFTLIASAIESARKTKDRARRPETHAREYVYIKKINESESSSRLHDYPDPSEDVIPIIDDTGTATDVYPTRRTSTSIYSTLSPPEPRKSFSGTGDAANRDGVDSSDKVTDSIYDWDSVKRSLNLRQNSDSGDFAEPSVADRRSGHPESMALQDRSPVTGLTPGPDTDSVRTNEKVTRTGSNGYNAGRAQSEQSSVLCRSACINASTPDTSRQIPVQPPAAQHQLSTFPYPPLIPANNRVIESYSMPGFPRAATCGPNKNMAGGLPNGLAILTPASRALLQSTLRAPPPEVRHEYCTDLNVITAATHRLATYEDKIARYKTCIAELKVKINDAVIAADAKKSKIMEEHAGSTQAALACSDSSSLDGRIAAFNVTSEQAKKELAIVSAELVKREERLQLQVKNLEEIMQAEKKGAEKLWEEGNNASKRKRKIEDTFGPHLAFWIGTEANNAMKRQRSE